MPSSNSSSNSRRSIWFHLVPFGAIWKLQICSICPDFTMKSQTRRECVIAWEADALPTELRPRE